MTFRNSLLIAFILSILLPLTILAAVFYSNTRRTTLMNIDRHLLFINRSKVVQYEMWIKSKSDMLRNFAVRPLVSRFTEVLVNDPPEELNELYRKVRQQLPAGPPLDSQPLEASGPESGGSIITAEAAYRLLIRDHIGFIMANEPDFTSLSIISARNGMIVVSSDPELAGSFRENKQYFTEGLKGLFVRGAYYSTYIKQPVITISHPVYNGSGGVIGVVAAQLNLKSLNRLILDPLPLHATEETYIVNDYDMLVTAGRSEKGRLLTRPARSEGIERALSGQSGVDSYIGYGGTKVIGAFAPLPGGGLAVLTEISSREAMGALNEFKIFFTLILAVSVVGVFFFVRMFIKSFSRPISDLIMGAEAIGSGDLAYRIEESRVIEFQELARSFNRMAERRQTAEVEIKKLSSLVKAATQGLRMADLEGKIVYMNPTLQKILGKTLKEAKEENIAKHYPPDLQDKFKEEVLPSLVDHGWWKGEMGLRSADGVTIPTLENFFVILGEDGKPEYIADVITDVTELKAMAEEIKQHRDRLEIMVDERTSELKKAMESLEQSNEDLQQFAYVASHDLKEPLRMISSYLQLFERRFGDTLTEEGREFLNFAVDGAVRMSRLIDDLLVFSRVRTHTSEFSEVDTNEVLGYVLQELSVAIQESGARVEIQDLPPVLGDESQIGQIFRNLLGNAIKFRGEKVPEIRVSAQKEGSFWRFSVKDNGIGIDPQFFDKIFIIFQRLHDRGKYPGTGIGLAVCRRITEIHGGRFWVESEPEKGSNFYFTLPEVIGDKGKGKASQEA